MQQTPLKHHCYLAIFLQINIRYFYNSWFMEFFTYNWPLMVMIMKLTMLPCNDNEKLCSLIMIIIHLFLRNYCGKDTEYSMTSL